MLAMTAAASEELVMRARFSSIVQSAAATSRPDFASLLFAGASVG